MRIFLSFLVTIVHILVVTCSNLMSDFVDSLPPTSREQFNHVGKFIRVTKRAAAVAANSLRGGKHFDREEDGFFQDFGFKKGQYFGEKEKTTAADFGDIRNNVPGEPGIDYPAHLEIPTTTFSCIGRNRGYYADEETDCQVFHVCDHDRVSTFLCPVGSLFSQHLLTCDWWSKVSCKHSLESREFYNHGNGNFNEILSEKKRAKFGYLQQQQQKKASNYIGPDKQRKDDTFHLQEGNNGGKAILNNEQIKFYNLNKIQRTDNNQPVDNKIYDGSTVTGRTTTTTATTTTSMHKGHENCLMFRIKKILEYSNPPNDQTTRDDRVNRHEQRQQQQEPTRRTLDSNSTPMWIMDKQSNTNLNNRNLITKVLHQHLKKNGITTTNHNAVSDDMEGKESVSLISAHSERNFEITTTEITASSSSSSSSNSSSNNNNNSTTQAIMESAIKDKVSSVGTESSAAESSEFSTRNSDGLDVHDDDDDNDNDDDDVDDVDDVGDDKDDNDDNDDNVRGMINERKTQNIHNLSGFKINMSPTVPESAVDEIDVKVTMMPTMMNNDVKPPLIRNNVHSDIIINYNRNLQESGATTIASNHQNVVKIKRVFAVSPRYNSGNLHEQNSSSVNFMTNQENVDASKQNLNRFGAAGDQTPPSPLKSYFFNLKMYQSTPELHIQQQQEQPKQSFKVSSTCDGHVMMGRLENIGHQQNIDNVPICSSSTTPKTKYDDPIGINMLNNGKKHQIDLAVQTAAATGHQRHNEQDPDLKKYTVNYHSQYFPETFLDYHLNEALYDETQVNKNEQDVNYDDADDKEENKDGLYFKNFGVRITAGTNDDEIISKLIGNVEISRKAHAINSQLLQLIPATIAAVDPEKLPRPFAAKQANVDRSSENNLSYTRKSDSKTSWQTSSMEKQQYDECVNFTENDPVNSFYSEKGIALNKKTMDGRNKTNVETELIPSFGFDFTNDEEKRDYYENYHQQEDAALSRERERNVPSDFF